MRLFCAVGECQQEILGKGILMWDPTQNIDWVEEGVKDVIHTVAEDGTAKQALALHLTCFEKFLQEGNRDELSSMILTIVVASVMDLTMALLTSEEDEDEPL